MVRKIDADIIKEASLLSAAAKAGMGLTKGVTKAGIGIAKKVGSNVIQHPIKSAGKALTASMAVGVASNVGKAGYDAIKDAKVYNPSKILPRTTFNVPGSVFKTAGEYEYKDHKYNTDKRVEFKYAPHIALGSIAGLALASKLTGGTPVKTLARGAAKGAVDVGKVINTPFRVATKVVRQAGGIVNKNKKETEYIAREAARTATAARAARAAKAARAERIARSAKATRFAKPMRINRGAQGFAGGAGFNNFDPSKLKKEVIDDVLRELGNKKPDTVKNILESVGRGAGIAGGAFAVHTAGDKYLKSKDKDELRAILRESRNDNPKRVVKNAFGKGPKLTEFTYKTPSQLAEEINELEKEAKFSPKKIKAIINAPLSQELMATSHRALINGSVSTMAYMATSSLKNKRSKAKGTSYNPDRIIVEIPLSELNKRPRKKANAEDVGIEKVSAIHPGVKRIALKNGKMALNAVAWVVPGIALAEVKSRVDKKGNAGLSPLDGGKARIIIETNNSAPNQVHMDSYRATSAPKPMRKSAEEKELIKKDINTASLDEQKKTEERRSLALRNVKLYEGIRKKHRMNAMAGANGMNE